MSDDDTSTDDTRGERSQGQGRVDEDRDERYASWEKRRGRDSRPEDVAAVATDRGPGWLDDRARWLLIVAGIVMIFVPEPVTSMIGLGFVVGGVLLWLADLFG